MSIKRIINLKFITIMEDHIFNSSGKLVLYVHEKEVRYQHQVGYEEPSNYYKPSIAKGTTRFVRYAMRSEVSVGMCVGRDNLISYNLKPDEVQAIIVNVKPDYALAICPELFFGEFADVKSKIETYSGRGVCKGEAFLPSFKEFRPLGIFDGPVDTILREDFGISLCSYKIDPGNTFSKTCNKYWLSDDNYSRAQGNEDRRLAVVVAEHDIHAGLETVRLRQGEAALGVPFLRFDYADCYMEMKVINPWD